ncbi:MAG: collagen-like protein [Ureaplasma parvum]|uniref:collagen-like triple helix repeat-containing protein n=1 Tax=Ureaplasma parvum TaxID=134821 RepID=UPI002913B136|nr:collagen-like protein [Ureaplasma parvum]MDU7892051.1 collagen-like protein [Ureaplasma parvum]
MNNKLLLSVQEYLSLFPLIVRNENLEDNQLQLERKKQALTTFILRAQSMIDDCVASNGGAGFIYSWFDDLQTTDYQKTKFKEAVATLTNYLWLQGHFIDKDYSSPIGDGISLSFKSENADFEKKRLDIINKLRVCGLYKKSKFANFSDDGVYVNYDELKINAIDSVHEELKEHFISKNNPVVNNNFDLNHHNINNVSSINASGNLATLNGFILNDCTLPNDLTTDKSNKVYDNAIANYVDIHDVKNLAWYGQNNNNAITRQELYEYCNKINSKMYWDAIYDYKAGELVYDLDEKTNTIKVYKALVNNGVSTHNIVDPSKQINENVWELINIQQIDLNKIKDGVQNAVDNKVAEIKKTIDAKENTFTKNLENKVNEVKQTVLSFYEKDKVAGVFKGEKGEPGIQGPIGPKGETGPKGEKGDSANVDALTSNLESFKNTALIGMLGFRENYDNLIKYLINDVSAGNREGSDTVWPFGTVKLERLDWNTDKPENDGIIPRMNKSIAKNTSNLLQLQTSLKETKNNLEQKYIKLENQQSTASSTLSNLENTVNNNYSNLNNKINSVQTANNANSSTITTIESKIRNLENKKSSNNYKVYSQWYYAGRVRLPENFKWIGGPDEEYGDTKTIPWPDIKRMFPNMADNHQVIFKWYLSLNFNNANVDWNDEKFNLSFSFDRNTDRNNMLSDSGETQQQMLLWNEYHPEFLIVRVNAEKSGVSVSLWLTNLANNSFATQFEVGLNYEWSIRTIYIGE